jgi:hypothetical protein
VAGAPIIVDVSQLVDQWTVDVLPALNRAILGGMVPLGALAAAMNADVLAGLPAADTIPPDVACRLVVDLGLAGGSVGRHHQQRHGTAEPERAFDALRVGPDGTGFLDYFAQLAGRTGTGHASRDSYASLIRWNGPTVEVTWQGKTVVSVGGAFDDGWTRSYTGASGERRFFELVKKSEAIERATNDMLEPIAAGAVPFESAEGLRRVRAATTLLEVLRRLLLEFPRLPPEQGMTPDHFMDVFRQFAVCWRLGDLPPSGALDPEAIKRDLLLGLDYPGYDGHIRRLFPALLDIERATIETMLAREPLPAVLLRLVGVQPTAARELPAEAWRDLLLRHPILADWYRLLHANARTAAAHLALSKRFLFKPQDRRENEGTTDSRLPVDNRRGTTGMTESVLEILARLRGAHLLVGLRGLVSRDVTSPDVVGGEVAAVGADAVEVTIGRAP